MPDKFKESAIVISQVEAATEIYSLWVQTKQIAQSAKPGQFLSFYTKDGSKLLPRPISICEIDKELNRIRVVYRVTGEHTGTKEFSLLKAGDAIDILGPLGNGFPVKDKKALIIGGGIGIPPMLELAKHITCERQIVAGYKEELFLVEDLRAVGSLYIATEDGSTGTKGNVIDVIKEQGLQADIIYACGPTKMLQAIKAYAKEQQVECYISMEERMACGIGACLACVCKSTETDHHTNVGNKRICKDGPVFLASEVEL